MGVFLELEPGALGLDWDSPLSDLETALVEASKLEPEEDYLQMDLDFRRLGLDLQQLGWVQEEDSTQVQADM